MFAGGESLHDLHGLQNLQLVGGDFLLQRNFLTDVDALSGLMHVGGTLRVAWNSALVSISGLASLAEIGGNVHIEDNDALTSVQPLADAIVRGDAAYISYCGSLPRCDAEDVMGSWMSGGFIGISQVGCNAPHACGGEGPECQASP